MFKEKLKGFVTGALAMGVLLGGFGAVNAKKATEAIEIAYNNIKIYVDGMKVEPKDANGRDIEPFIYNGTTYLPVRAVGEAMGKTVNWDGATQTVYLGAKPGASEYMTDILPAYESGGVLDNAYRYKEYSAITSGGTESFNLGGVKYLDGITIHEKTWAVWNTNSKYKSMTGVLCHVDGTDSWINASGYPQILYIYCDGVLRDEIELTPSMAPKMLTINLEGVNQLKIATSRFNRYDVWYGIGNPVLVPAS